MCLLAIAALLTASGLLHPSAIVDSVPPSKLTTRISEPHVPPAEARCLYIFLKRDAQHRAPGLQCGHQRSAMRPLLCAAKKRSGSLVSTF